MYRTLVRIVASSIAAALVLVGLVSAPAFADATTGSISGHVSLGDPSMSAGAGQVKVSYRGGTPSTSGIAFTDANGDFEIANLNPGNFEVFFDFLPSGDFADEYFGHYYGDRQRPLVGVVAGQTTLNVDAVLSPGAVVAGHVSNTTGDDLAGVDVIAQASMGYVAGGFSNSAEFRTVTDDDGNYVLSGLPASANWQVRFETDGVPAVVDGILTYVDDYVDAVEYFSLDAGQTRSGRETTLYRFTMVYGWLTCAGCTQDRMPEYLARLERRVDDTWTEMGTGYTSSYNGYVDFRNLVPGNYRLTLTSPGRATISVPPFDLVDGQSLELGYIGIPFTGTFVPKIVGTNRVGTRLTVATGSLSPAPTTFAYWWKRDGVVMPVDGDSYLLTDDDLGHTITVVVNADRTGYSTRVGTTDPTGPIGPRPERGDFDGDDNPDILVRNAAGKLIVVPGKSDGTLASSTTIGTGWKSFSSVIRAGDKNGDGVEDVLVRETNGTLRLYKGDGAGKFLPGYLKIGTGWQHYSIFGAGDFTGDGLSDLMARDSSGYLWLYPGKSDGKFLSRVKVGSGWKNFTAMFSPGDFNGDGHPDVIARDKAGVLWLYPGDGARLGSKVALGSGFKSATSIFGPGDFTGDGKQDLGIRDSSGSVWIYPNDDGNGLLDRYRIATGWSKLSFVV